MFLLPDGPISHLIHWCLLEWMVLPTGLDRNRADVVYPEPGSKFTKHLLVHVVFRYLQLHNVYTLGTKIHMNASVCRLADYALHEKTNSLSSSSKHLLVVQVLFVNS